MAVHLRLALGELRARPQSAFVLLCSLTVAAAALGVGLTLRAQADRPWDRTFAAANGAHVVASSADAELLRELTRRPDVAAATGPLGETFGTMRTRGGSVLLARLVEAPPPEAPVDRPLLLSGTHARPGGVVVEATHARTLGLRVGDPVELGPAEARPHAPPVIRAGPGHALRVAGIAVVASQAPFPATQPGLLLVDPADLRVVSAGHSVGAVVLLRLHDPAAADTVAQAARARGHVLTGTWQDRRAEALSEIADQRVLVLTFAALLLLTAAATAAVLASARAVAGAREAALLRAVGVTPRAAVAVAVTANVAVTAAAALLGWLAAQPLAAAIASRAAVALATPAEARLDLRVLVVVAAVLVPVVALATALPLLRGTRVPSVVALAGGTAARSYGTSWLAGWAERRLPFTVGLGARYAAARPARRLLTMVTIVLAVAAAVASVGIDATLDRETATATTPAGFVAVPASELLRPVAYALMALLGATALAGVIATTLAAATETRRDDALLRAAGATARQLLARTACGTAFTAVVAAVVGLPVGLGLFRAAYSVANGSTEGAVAPGALELHLVAVAAVAVTVTGAAAVAHRAARVRPAEVLRQV